VYENVTPEGIWVLLTTFLSQKPVSESEASAMLLLCAASGSIHPLRSSTPSSSTTLEIRHGKEHRALCAEVGAITDHIMGTPSEKVEQKPSSLCIQGEHAMVSPSDAQGAYTHVRHLVFPTPTAKVGI